MLLDVLRMDELASIKTMFVDFFSDIRSGLIGQVEAKIEEFNVLVLPEVEKRIMANKATEEMIVELKKKMMQLENEVIVARSELAELRSQLERNHTRQLAAGCGKCHCVDEPNEDSQLTTTIESSESSILSTQSQTESSEDHVEPSVATPADSSLTTSVSETSDSSFSNSTSVESESSTLSTDQSHSTSPINHSTKPCPVDGCHYRTTFRSELTRHTRMFHSDSMEAKKSTMKPMQASQAQVRKFKYYWPRCGRKFPKKQTMREHHVRLKFKCKWSMCAYRSERESNLLSHIRLVHLSLPNTRKQQLELNIPNELYYRAHEYVEILHEGL